MLKNAWLPHIFFLDTNGTYKDLLSMDSFKPHKNITVFESITHRKTRVSRDAQNICTITIVGTALNQDLQKLSTWFSSNYLTVNYSKAQAMILGNFNYQPVLTICNSIIEIESFLEILGVHIDNILSLKVYVSAILKKVYAKIGALRRLKRLVPPDVALILYKCYILPHLEYCSPLLLGINKTLANNLEAANYYALKVLLNVVKDVDYNSILSIAGMNSLEFRRYEQPLSLLYKCIKGNGPSYISDFFKFP